MTRLEKLMAEEDMIAIMYPVEEGGMTHVGYDETREMIEEALEAARDEGRVEGMKLNDSWFPAK